MKNIKYLFLLVATVFLLNSCETGMPETADLNYVTFEATAIDLGVLIEGTNDYELAIYTTQITSSERTFNINVDMESTTADDAAYSVPATVTVPANSNKGTFVVTLNDVNIGGEGKSLVLDLGVDDGVFKGEAATIYISQICEQNEVIINLTFDDWGSECSWEMLNASDEIVASGSGYADGDAGASAKLCLENGTYTFTVYDVYGDGGTSVAIIHEGTEIATIDGAGYTTSETVILEISK